MIWLNILSDRQRDKTIQYQVIYIGQATKELEKLLPADKHWLIHNLAFEERKLGQAECGLQYIDDRSEVVGRTRQRVKLETTFGDDVRSAWIEVTPTKKQLAGHLKCIAERKGRNSNSDVDSREPVVDRPVWINPKTGKKITLDTIGDAMRKACHAKGGGLSSVMAILKSAGGVNKLSDLKPERFEAMLDALKAMPNPANAKPKKRKA